MHITRQTFMNALRSPNGAMMNIVLEGMSGAGKSYWSQKLAESYGFRLICIDDLIGETPEQAALIKDIAGADLPERMGRYFRMPWTEGFSDREAAYLPIERRIMESCSDLSGCVIDLTGSSIYHPAQMQKFSKTGLMVYLEAREGAQAEMLETFLNHPKPVCWNGVFNMLDGEAPDQALARCYSELLRTRAALYENYADVTIPYDVHKSAGSADDLVQAIADRLPVSSFKDPEKAGEKTTRETRSLAAVCRRLSLMFL